MARVSRTESKLDALRRRVAELEGESDRADAAEQALTGAREQYRRLFERTGDAMLLVQAEQGLVVDCNRKAENLLGRPRDAIVGRCQTELLPTFLAGHLRAALRGQAPHGTAAPTAGRISRSDGTIRHVQLLTSVQTQHGEQLALAILRDMTDLHGTELRQWDSETLLKTALDTSQVGITIADAPDGRISYMNDAAAAIGGKEKREAVDRVSIEEFVETWPILRLDGTPYPPEEVPLARALQRGETCSEEFILRHKDGTERVIWAKAAPIKNERGEVIRGIVHSLDITDRWHTKEALRRSQRRLSHAQRIARTGDFTWDTGTGEVTWSDALFNLLGFDRSEHIDCSKVYAQIHHPDDVDRVTQWLNECVASGSDELVPNEYRILRKDGSVLQVRTRGVIQRPAGRAPFVVGTVRDITELKQADEQLRASEKRFRTLFESTPYGIVICELIRDDGGRPIDFVHVDANAATATHLETDLDRIVGHRASEMTSAEELAFVLDVCERVVSTGKPETYCRYFSDFDRTVEVTVFSLGGNLFISNFTDVSDRTRMQDALAEHERRLRTLMGNLPGVAYRCRNDPQRTMEFASEGCLRLTGCTPDDLGGQGGVAYGDLILPADRQMVRQVIEDALANRKPFEAIYRIRATSGVEKWVWEQGQGVRDKDGRVSALEGYIADITEDRQAEQALRDSSERLRLAVQAASMGTWEWDLRDNRMA